MSRVAGERRSHALFAEPSPRSSVSRATRRNRFHRAAWPSAIDKISYPTRGVPDRMSQSPRSDRLRSPRDG